MWVCACYVCILAEILRHFFGYQTSERNWFAQKHNIDVSIEPNVQLMFVYITKLVLISSPCTWPTDWEKKSQALVWTVSTITAYAIVDSSSSKALVILESLLHFTGIWVEKTLFPLCGLGSSKLETTYKGDGKWRKKEKCKLHFLFSNPQVIVRRKQQMLWHTIQDASSPSNKEKKKEKRTLSSQSKNK